MESPKYKIVCGDHMEVGGKIKDGYVDLIVTSPPYDDLRSYNGYVFDWKRTLAHCWRVLKVGGVLVWISSDMVFEGSETGTSFRQALYAKDLGFKLHDTMIYLKEGVRYPCATRYHDGWEFMFILSKGKISTVNLIRDRPNKSAGRTVTGTGRQPDGSTRTKACIGNVIGELGIRYNYWLILDGSRGITQHPATFYRAIPRDHILSWSNPGDIVYDPMMGSGTTIIEAIKLGRKAIGIEISQEYFDEAKERIEREWDAFVATQNVQVAE